MLSTEKIIRFFIYFGLPHTDREKKVGGVREKAYVRFIF